MGAESLQAACELAFVVAREDSESGYEVEPPASMRSFLYVSDLPRRAISVAQQAIEDDSEFRSRVAAQANEDSVGRAGYLWLHRPAGWAQEFERLTAEDEDEDFEDEAAGEVVQPEEIIESSEPPPPMAPPPPVVEAIESEPDIVDAVDAVQAEPDPEVEEVYNDLMSAPIELVSAQPPDPLETDYSFDPGETFSPESPPISDAPMASVSLIGGQPDVPDPPPPSFELASMGTAAVTDRANYEVVEDTNFTPFSEGEGVVMESGEMDFEADALENELSSLRGLVDRLAGEREMVVSNLPSEASGPETPPVDTVGGRELESEIMALESDLDSIRHELDMAQHDLQAARHEREEAQRLQSQALKRQVDLEKELAAVREQRVEVENQASEAQVAAISFEDKLARTQALLEEADRERNVTKSQLETMTSERNQIREDRVAIKAERDDLYLRVADVEEKTGGVDVGELTAANKSMTVELEATSRELARMIAQAESLEEQIATTTTTADSLKTAKVELTSRLADTELALETTRTQHEALKTDSERLAAEVGTLRAERDALQTQLTELQASLADVLNEQAETRQRHDADRQELNELRIERDVLMARMNDLEQADRDYETRIKALVGERDDLVAARDDLISERGQLRGEAAASAAEKDQMHEKLTASEAKIGPLETELQAERRQREELANRLLELDDIAEQDAAKIARLTEEQGISSARLEELEAERVDVQELRTERDGLTAQLSESETRYEDELTRTNEQLTDVSNQLTELEEAKATLEQENSEAQTELKSIRVEFDKASKNLARLTEAEDQAKVALTDARASVESLTAELEAAKEGKAEAEAHLALAEEARTDLSAQLESQKLFAAEKAEEAETALNEARMATEARSAAETRAAEAVSEAAAAIEAASFSSPPTIIEQAPVEDSTDKPVVAEVDDKLEIPSSETVSVDLASLPSPFITGPSEAAADATEGEEEATSDDDGFDWPPPARDAEDDGDSLLGSKPPTILAAPSQLADHDLDDLDADEDDLDEVSELIAQTVSSFGQDDALDDVSLAADDATSELSLTDTDLVAEVDDDKIPGLSDMTSAPPSIFGSSPAKGSASDQLDGGAKRQPGSKRRQIDVPSDILDDEVAVAQFVVSSPDVVLLVDGDSVAKLGWPSYAVAQQRDALVTYLADLLASSGAAPDVVFDGRIGDDDSLPASRAVRIRLSTPPTEPAAALDELVDAYPEQWPIALVTDDADLAASAAERGAAVLNNGQLLDLFISE